VCNQQKLSHHTKGVRELDVVGRVFTIQVATALLVVTAVATTQLVLHIALVALVVETVVLAKDTTHGTALAMTELVLHIEFATLVLVVVIVKVPEVVT